MATILEYSGASTPGASFVSGGGAVAAATGGISQAALVKSRNQTPIPSVPTRNPMWDGDGTEFGKQVVAALGNLNRTWYYFFQRRSGGGAGGSSGFTKRTLLVRDTTVGNNIADDEPVETIPFGGNATCQEVLGVLRKAITADLTVRLTIYIAGSPTLVGSFTIPAATAVRTAIRFSGPQILNATFPDLGVLVFDIVASDGSIDGKGVAAFTVVYQ